MYWLVHISGIDDPAGRWYLWWSGFEADLTQLALVWALVTFIRVHTCCLKRCVRRNRHLTVDGLGVCSKHFHPEIADGIDDTELHRLDRYARRVIELKRQAEEAKAA